MDKDTCSVYMRYASVAAGDIDFDGFPEVVVAGVYSDNDGPDGDKSGSNKKYMLVTLKYDPNEDVETLIPSGGNVMDMCNFVNAGFDKDDNVHPLPALTCAAVNGRNDAEQVFLDGVFWKFENESWKKDYTAKVCQSSDKGIGGYIISDTWVDGCVAGNFDENDLGIEQVLYTTGYKQQSFNRYFYRVNMSGKEQNKNSSTGICTPGSYFDSSSNELVRHVGMSDFPCLAIAAVDADKDTDVFTFKSKKYTYSNVDILAILQAAPYFGELQDNYYNGNIGETLYGKLSGQGTVTSKTKMASIGAYASFSIGSSALQFHTEASYTHDWEWSYEDELSHEYSISFENDGTKNQVVLYRTPVILYEYVITPANGSASYTMEVGVQQQPVFEPVDVGAVGEERHLPEFAQQLGVVAVAHRRGYLLHDALAHAVDQQVGTAVDKDRGFERILPVVVVGEPPQRRFDAAHHHRRAGIEPFEDAGVGLDSVVGAEARRTARGVGVVAAQTFVGRIVVDHRVHGPGRHGEEEARRAELAEIAQVVAPVGLRNHRYAVTFCFEQAADDRRAESRMVDVGVAREENDVPAPLAGLLDCGRQKSHRDRLFSFYGFRSASVRCGVSCADFSIFVSTFLIPSIPSLYPRVARFLRRHPDIPRTGAVG